MGHPLATTHTLRVPLSPLELTGRGVRAALGQREDDALRAASNCSCRLLLVHVIEDDGQQPQAASARRNSTVCSPGCCARRPPRAHVNECVAKGCMGVGSGWRPLGEWPRRSGRPPASMRSNSSSTSGCSVCTTTTVGINHEPDRGLRALHRPSTRDWGAPAQ